MHALTHRSPPRLTHPLPPGMPQTPSRPSSARTSRPASAGKSTDPPLSAAELSVILAKRAALGFRGICWKCESPIKPSWPRCPSCKAKVFKEHKDKTHAPGLSPPPQLDNAVLAWDTDPPQPDPTPDPPSAGTAAKGLRSKLDPTHASSLRDSEDVLGARVKEGAIPGGVGRLEPHAGHDEGGGAEKAASNVRLMTLCACDVAGPNATASLHASWGGAEGSASNV